MKWWLLVLLPSKPEQEETEITFILQFYPWLVSQLPKLSSNFEDIFFQLAAEFKIFFLEHLGGSVS